MKRLNVTEVDLKRYKVLTDVFEGKIDLKRASEVLGLSYRHTLRLRDRFKKEGFEGIIRKYPQKPPNEKITSNMRQMIVSLRERLYKDFNIFHLRDKLENVHGIKLSYESLRQILRYCQLPMSSINYAKRLVLFHHYICNTTILSCKT